MDKIDHLNYFANLDPKVKKEKSKKSNKSENSKSIYKEKTSLFFKSSGTCARNAS